MKMIAGRIVLVATLIASALAMTRPSPVGAQVVDRSLIVFRPVAGGIGLVDADGSNLRIIQPGPLSDDATPDLSPDGQHVLYMADSCGGFFCYTLFVANLDGSNRQQLSFSGAGATGGRQEDGRWSPDGSAIAFDQNRTGYQNPQQDICIATSTGTNERCIATGTSPWWAPDGQHLVYQAVTVATTPTAPPSYQSTPAGIAVTDLAGHVRHLTSDPNDQFPSWSPDGQHISFARPDYTSNSVTSSLMVMNSDGSGLHALATVQDGYSASNWSPDSTQMVVAGVNSPVAIIIDRDGHLVRQVAGAAGTSATWIRPTQPVGACGSGYWLAASDGGVFSFGDHAFYGSTGATHLNRPIVGIGPSATRHGYWLVAADGGIFTFGDAAFYGSTGAIHLNQPIVGMAPTPSGHGYWLVAADGGIFTFGDASFFGSTGALRLNQPIVGMAPTPSGHGYWLVAADGGIFTFGDAGFFGSTGAIKLNRPIVGMAPTPTGHGYWLVASDGGVFTFGDATFHGSSATTPPAARMIGVAPTSGAGYWLVAADGQIYTLGAAAFCGSTYTVPLSRPIMGFVN